MYIDIHIHANACSDEGFNFEKLTEWMATNRVSQCVVLQFHQTMPQNDEERQQLVATFRQYRDRIHRFDVLAPDEVASTEEAVSILTRLKAEGVIGFGEHYGRGLAVDDAKNMRLYAACAEVGLPVLFHMDGSNNIDEDGLPGLERVLKANPTCTFIGHGPGWWAAIRGPSLSRLLLEYANIYGDLSAGSGARAISHDKACGREFLIRHTDKLMFGTDSGPWSYGKPPAPQFALLKELGLPADVEAKIYRRMPGES